MTCKIRLNWKTVILPLLREQFTAKDPKEIEDRFGPIWHTLSGYVHPSATMLGDLVDESALLARDAFDENLANKSLDYATEVFDLLWLAVLWQFPKAKPSAAG